MKSITKIMGLLSALVLVGCSNMPGSQVRAGVDKEYVSQVESVSVRNSQNLTIYWVNPPLKKVQRDSRE